MMSVPKTYAAESDGPSAPVPVLQIAVSQVADEASALENVANELRGAVDVLLGSVPTQALGGEKNEKRPDVPPLIEHLTGATDRVALARHAIEDSVRQLQRAGLSR